MLYDSCKEMSRAVGVKKPQESQKAKALWKNEGSSRMPEKNTSIQSVKTSILGRNNTRLALWEEYLKDPIVALDKALKCVEISCWRFFGPRTLVEGAILQWPALASFKVCGRSRSGRAFGLAWIRWIVCVYAQWNVPGKYGRHGELFFFLIQQEPATAPGSETFSPLFSAYVLKKCALIALHLIAEERGGDGEGGHAPGLRDEWKMGCLKSPMWESESEAWSEGNVCNDVFHVIGLHGPGGKISLFLKDWELAKVALSCHVALDMLCQEMREAWSLGDAAERLAVTA